MGFKSESVRHLRWKVHFFLFRRVQTPTHLVSSDLKGHLIASDLKTTTKHHCFIIFFPNPLPPTTHPTTTTVASHHFTHWCRRPPAATPPPHHLQGHWWNWNWVFWNSIKDWIILWEIWSGKKVGIDVDEYFMLGDCINLRKLRFLEVMKMNKIEGCVNKIKGLQGC